LGAQTVISLGDAQARIVEMAQRLDAETLPIADAAGRWLAEDVVALRTQPAHDLSAMDGYAMAAGMAESWCIVGESAAGQRYNGAVGTGETVRIFTGAALPEGADTIVIQENVTRDGSRITLAEGNAAVAGRHVRRRGSDFETGTLLVPAGIRLNPAQVALAATGGHGSVRVARLPRIAILATGNELVPPGAPPGDDQLPESNATMLAAMLGKVGATVQPLGIARDDINDIASRITAADADLLITLGGASVGDHDLVRPALDRCGATMDFWKVAMRPGKPVMAGRLGAMMVIGLPGNPVSAYVTALLLVEPVVRAMMGAAEPFPARDRARLAAALPPNGPRTDHIRATMGINGVAPTGPNDSAALSALSRSNALIVRVPDAPAAEIGEMVEIIRIQ
jgi:molybdopterin molybdotransferase